MVGVSKWEKKQKLQRNKFSPAQEQTFPIKQAVWNPCLLSVFILNALLEFLHTVIDGAAVATEVGFHQRSLFLALFGPSSARPPVHSRLDHQRLLPLLLLLLLKERPLCAEH